MPLTMPSITKQLKQIRAPHIQDSNPVSTDEARVRKRASRPRISRFRIRGLQRLRSGTVDAQH